MDVSVNVGLLGAAASAFISRPHKLLIDGKWVAPQGGKTFPVFDPATGGQIAQVADGGPADIDLAVKAARRAFETVERNARAQAQLIDDLLDVSRIVTGKLRVDVRPIDPNSFIEAAVEAGRRTVARIEDQRADERRRTIPA